MVEGLGVSFLTNINFLDYQYLLFGIALVLMMLFRPEGLFPSQRRRRELHVADELVGEFDEGEPDEPGLAGSMGDAPGGPTAGGSESNP
jgi:hypothetical protein